MKISSIAFVYGMICAGAACVGDSAFKVSGQVVDEHGKAVEGCRLERRRYPDDRVAETHRINSTFVDTFTVAPGANKFVLGISCDGYELYRSAIISISGSEAYETPIELGVIKVTLKDVAESN